MQRTVATITTLAAVLLICVLFASGLNAQTTLGKDVTDALDRLASTANGDLSAYEKFGKDGNAIRLRDQAILFSNNDAINAAGLNGDIPASKYRAAQKNFETLNTTFGRQAAADTGVKIEAQQRVQGSISRPGTDTDLIARVRSPEQIGEMQTNYNRRVNDYLKAHGAIEKPHEDWHKKLDTDFMADPDLVTDPEDFRRISEMNNDAYKRRASAHFERIKRAEGGGRIGPEHVTAYTDDMADLAAKKRGGLDNMLNNPSLISDPQERARVIQMMAQEQKYISRMEALDDYLRNQEGLPPRNRGTSKAKQGSLRDPSNTQAIKQGHRVGKASQGQAIADLAETMAEVAAKNPESDFAKSSADDIARIISRAPPEHRGAAMARLSRRNPDLAKAVIRSPDFSRVDDLPGRGRVTGLSSADDFADVGLIRQGLGAAAEAMEKLGRAADVAEVAQAAAKIKDMYTKIRTALDPSITAEESNQLLDEAEKISSQLIETGVLGALFEAFPPAAMIYGTWIFSRHGGEWILTNTQTGQSVIRAAGNLVDWDAMADLWVRGAQGHGAVAARNQAAQCNRIKRWISEGRITVKNEHTAEEICHFWKEKGLDGIRDMVAIGPKGTRQASLPPDRCKAPEDDLAAARAVAADGRFAAAEGMLANIDIASCPQLKSSLDAAIAGIRTQVDSLVTDAASTLQRCQPDTLAAFGRRLAASDHPRIASLQERLTRAGRIVSEINTTIAQANTSYLAGDFRAARTAMQRARAHLRSLGGNPTCPAIMDRIERGIGKIDKMESAVARIDEAIESCSASRMAAFSAQIAGMGSSHPMLSEKQATMDRLVPVVSQASDAFEKANAAYEAGAFGEARAHLRLAKTRAEAFKGEFPCSGLIKRIETGLVKIEKITGVLSQAEKAISDCTVRDIMVLRVRLAPIKDSHFMLRDMARRLEKAQPPCVAREKQAYCREKHGRAHAKLSGNGCQCEKGYRFGKGGRCVTKKVEQQRSAARAVAPAEKAPSEAPQLYDALLGEWRFIGWRTPSGASQSGSGVFIFEDGRKFTTKRRGKISTGQWSLVGRRLTIQEPKNLQEFEVKKLDPSAGRLSLIYRSQGLFKDTVWTFEKSR